MNRELAEVRRYWPRARVQWRDTDATCYCVPGAWCITHRYHVVIVRDTVSLSGHSRVSAPTIAEAMRAAGFGTRPLGGFARTAASAALLACDQPQLADRQRPRKGVRLGRRKRREVQP